MPGSEPAAPPNQPSLCCQRSTLNKKPPSPPNPQPQPSPPPKGNNLVPGGDFWAIDSDMKVLGSCEAQHTIQITAEEDAAIPPAELRRLAGDAAGGGKLPATMPAAATAGGRWRRPLGGVAHHPSAGCTLNQILA